MTATRAAALGLAALASYAAVLIATPGQAHAATAYRYWAYYVAAAHANTSTSWQYSQRGPATEYPVDGEVQGWRFGVQVDAANGLLPRAAPNFATLCKSTPARAGELRVGVVIDFGLATDAPAHERPPAGVVPGCVYLHDGATGADVLAAATTFRIGTGADAGLVCGIDGYPKTECAVAVATHPSPSVAPPTRASANPRVIVTSQPVAAPTSGPTAAAASVTETVAPVNSAAATSATVSAHSSAQAGPATASALSLAALRSSSHQRHDFSATTIAGIALIVILGAGALWRSRVRRR